MLKKNLVFNFIYGYLIANGLHIGHSKPNSILQASQFFYKIFRNFIIINVFYTSIFLKKSLEIFLGFFKRKGDFWFINKDISFNDYISILSLSCGEMFLNFKWIPGLLTNFKIIIKNLSNFFFLKNLNNYKDSEFFDSFMGLLFWTSFPKSLVVLNPVRNYLAPKEVVALNFFKGVCLVDTNFDSSSIFYSIPMNDDSLKSLTFISKIFSIKIILSKLAGLRNWYSFKKIRFFKVIFKFKKFRFLPKFLRFLKLFYSNFSKFCFDDNFLLKHFLNDFVFVKFEREGFFFIRRFFKIFIKSFKFDIYNLRYKSYELYFNKIKNRLNKLVRL